MEFDFIIGHKHCISYSIGSGICHRESAKPIVNDIKVLIFELVAVDTLSTSSIKVGEVSALYIDRSMKVRSVKNTWMCCKKEV